jgi:hypothetical protein
MEQEAKKLREALENKKLASKRAKEKIEHLKQLLNEHDEKLDLRSDHDKSDKDQGI